MENDTQCANDNVTDLPPSSLEGIIPTNVNTLSSKNIHIEQLIGSGGFAQVFKCTYDFGGELGRRKVALKQLNAALISEAGPELQRELAAMGSLDAHPNIITMIGAVAETDKCGIVLEFAQFGSLFELLHDKNKTIELSDKIQLLLDVSEGMHSLHSHSPNFIVHLDMKSMNVLLFDAGDGRMVAKVYPPLFTP
jgi:serine/threonine protein kinase